MQCPTPENFWVSHVLNQTAPQVVQLPSDTMFSYLKKACICSSQTIAPCRSKVVCPLAKICFYLWLVWPKLALRTENFLSGSQPIQNWHSCRSKICLATSQCTCCAREQRAYVFSDNKCSCSFHFTLTTSARKKNYEHPPEFWRTQSNKKWQKPRKKP